MIAKMENLGCEQSVVGLVIPTDYSFNLDGTCIYLTWLCSSLHRRPIPT
jgi:aerobic C4-dicarboxylate transport protein